MGVLLLDEQTAPGTPSTGQVVLYPKSDGLLYSKDDAGAETAVTGLAAASQAEQEAGSSTLVATTPGRQHFHQSAAKAWVNFTGSGTVTINSDYNVTSITDNATGDYSINWDTDFSSIGYSIAGAASDDNTAASFLGLRTSTPFAAGSAQVSSRSHDGTLRDAGIITVVAFGDL
jgi:hypothetical protein